MREYPLAGWNTICCMVSVLVTALVQIFERASASVRGGDLSRLVRLLARLWESQYHSCPSSSSHRSGPLCSSRSR